MSSVWILRYRDASRNVFPLVSDGFFATEEEALTEADERTAKDRTSGGRYEVLEIPSANTPVADEPRAEDVDESSEYESDDGVRFEAYINGKRVTAKQFQEFLDTHSALFDGTQKLFDSLPKLTGAFLKTPRPRRDPLDSIMGSLARAIASFDSSAKRES